MKKIAFNTANLVARFTGYQFELAKWGEQDRITRERTGEKEFAAICAEIAAAGFRAVEIWVAHVDPPAMTDARADTYRSILADNGLAPIGLAAPLNGDTARVCRQLHIPVCNGGLCSSDLVTEKQVHASTGIAFNYENHPEKSVEEIRSKIAGGGAGIGLAIDTGWLTTNGMDAPATVLALGPLVKHVHLKDVKTVGGHETVPLGTGATDIAGVIGALKAIGYGGWYSWEDEPEARNPFVIAAETYEWISQRID